MFGAGLLSQPHLTGQRIRWGKTTLPVRGLVHLPIVFHHWRYTSGSIAFTLIESLELQSLTHVRWDKPNWRAIRVGVIPALNAARTAFNRPRVKEARGKSRALSGVGLSLGSCLPLRLISAHAAVMSRSSSSSPRYLIAFAKSLGKTCLGKETAAASSVGFDIDQNPFLPTRSHLIGSK
jgi:hypothetical protein